MSIPSSKRWATAIKKTLGKRLGKSSGNDNSTDFDDENYIPKRRTTPLHKVCMTSGSLEDIRVVLNENPSDTNVRDMDGKLPLHLLAENKIITHNMIVLGKIANQFFKNKNNYESDGNGDHGGAGIINDDFEAAMNALEPLKTFIIDEFLPKCPMAPAVTDDSGRIPFTQIIVKWIIEIHQNELDDNDEMPEDIVGDKSNNHVNHDKENHGDINNNNEDDDDRVEKFESEPSFEDSEIQAADLVIRNNNICNAIETFIPMEFITLTPQIEWSLMMIDTILEKMVEEQAARMVENVAAIRAITKVLLLISDTEKSERLLNTTIMKRVLLHKTSTGNWLVPMLKNEEYEVKKRGVYYLYLLSNIGNDEKERKRASKSSISSSAGSSSYNFKKILSLFKQFTGKNKIEVYRELSKQQDLPLALVQLPSKLFGEAATLDAITWMLDEKVFQPGAIALYIVFLDILFFCVLIINFRMAVFTYFGGVANLIPDSFEYKAWNLRMFSHSICICVSTTYFFLKTLNIFRSVSFKVVIENFGFFFINDLVSIALTFSTTVMFIHRVRTVGGCDDCWVQTGSLFYDDSKAIRPLAAVATGLLWLKALSFLKVLNRYLATFVLAFVQITKDIMWFLLILFVFIIASTQMFYTVLFQPIEVECQGSENSINEGNVFCSTYPKDTYLYVYGIVLGDFSLGDYYTSFAVVLFVLYTFGVVIILLNVLIAIVSDSYDKSVMQSARLFAQARILFVAELIAVERSMAAKHILRICVILFISIFIFFSYWMINGEGAYFAYVMAIAAITYGFVFYLVHKCIKSNPHRRFTIVSSLALGSILTLFLFFFLEVSNKGGTAFMIALAVGIGESLITVWCGPIMMILWPILRQLSRVLDNILLFTVGLIVSRSGSTFQLGNDDSEGSDVWAGKITHLENQFIKNLKDSEHRLMAILSSAEQRITVLGKSDVQIKNSLLKSEVEIDELKKLMLSIKKELQIKKISLE